MITLDSLQVWAVIGTFAAGLFGMLGFIMSSVQRTIRTEIGSLRTEIGSEVGSVRSEIGSEVGSLRSEVGSLKDELRSEIASLRQEMAVRFDAVANRIDHLDRDVQFLMKRELEDRA